MQALYATPAWAYCFYVFTFLILVLSVVQLSSAFYYLSLRAGPPRRPPLFVSSSWSASMTSFNHQANDVIEEVDVKDALKSSIFVVQKAAAPKTGVEFCQGSIGTIRSSLATSYDVWRRRATSPTFDQSEAEKLSLTHTQTENRHTGRCCSTSSACKKLVRSKFFIFEAVHSFYLFLGINGMKKKLQRTNSRPFPGHWRFFKIDLIFSRNSR